MIFVVKPVVRCSLEDVAKIQKKLYEDLNAPKDKVLALHLDVPMILLTIMIVIIWL